ncbi:MAG: hypothetical protein LBD99_01015, partial [Candidatus Margulisbacteria bacterium]|nr:hypothetical protein [Candidatus Margulisiibacteriota bacterium]
MKKRWFLFLLFSAALAARTTLVDLDGVFASPRATALGMSGAAEARAEDIFLNQFGLAGLQNFGFYGSSYRLYDDTNYLNGVLYFPAGPVGLGVGYRLRAVNDVLLTPPDMFGTDGRLDLDRIERVNYQQSALHLSAGYRLEHFLGWQALDLGLAYKSYTVQNSAADLDSLTAQGSNVDLGFLARVNDLWRWSLIGRNVVNGDGVQGSLVWRSGTAEQMVRSVVLGNRLAFNENRLIFLLDVNYYAEDYAPVLLNAGAEGRINNFLALRGGLRQYTLLTGGGEQRVFTAVSAGFGLNPWRGIQLDYAYYPGDDLGLEALHYA